MKKILYVLLFFSVLTLVGCFDYSENVGESEIIDDSTNPDDLEPNVKPNEPIVIKDGILTYSTWSHDGTNLAPEKYAEIKITELEYRPFNKKLCFTIDITDKDYMNTTYWIIKRPRGTVRTESQISFKIQNTTKSLYHCEYLTPDSEIVLGLVNSKDLNPSPSMDVLAWIKIDDEKADSRIYPEGGYFTTRYFTTDEKYTEKIEPGSPYILMDLKIVDSARLLEGIYMELYYRPFDMIYQTKEILFTEDMYVDDTIRLNTILFEDLPPDVEFEINYYYKGTDGVDVYDYYSYFGSRTVRSTTTGMTSYIKESYPGLWANITGYDIGETTTTVYYELVNDGDFLLFGEPVHTEIGIAGKDVRIPIEPTSNSVEIENVYLENYDAIQIYIKDSKRFLCSTQINYNLFNLFEFARYSNGVFKYRLANYNVDIISIEFEVRVVKNGTPILKRTLTEFPESAIWPNYQSIDVDEIPLYVYGDTYVDFVVTYYGLTGIETFEQSSQFYSRP